MGFRIEYSVLTHQGNRDVNEDSVGAFRNDDGCCLILCDGLGGHGMGDQASSLVVSVFESQFKNNIKAKNFLADTFTAAEEILLTEQAARNAKRKMKTTGVALVSDNKYAYIGHVGDSRLYVFRDNKVFKRTLDHSIPQMLVLSGQINESEIRNHPDRSTILRVLGIEWEEPMYELMKPLPLRKCQAFLLCSDGFWELIEEKDMCALLEKAENPEQWLNEMHKIVMANGIGKNMDNNSAIAAWVIKDKIRKR